MEKYVDEIGDLSPSRMKKMKKDIKDVVMNEFEEHQDMCTNAADCQVCLSWHFAENATKYLSNVFPY